MLYNHITQQRNQNEATNKYATPVPTFLHLSNDQEYIVFSQLCEDKPTVFFYDLKKKDEVIKVENAEVFLTAVKSTPSVLLDDHLNEYLVLFKTYPSACKRTDG